HQTGRSDRETIRIDRRQRGLNGLAQAGGGPHPADHTQGRHILACRLCHIIPRATKAKSAPGLS
ncbi:MAG: hypothetical protein AAF386_13715, partial [Pseudomonadota bacterium]